MSRDDRAIKRIVPFSIHVEIKFQPDEQFSAYRVSATGRARLGEIDTIINVYPLLGLTSAQWLCDLQFGIRVDANILVPFVNKANKE